MVFGIYIYGGSLYFKKQTVNPTACFNAKQLDKITCALDLDMEVKDIQKNNPFVFGNDKQKDLKPKTLILKGIVVSKN